MNDKTRQARPVSDQRKAGNPPTNLHITHQDERAGNEWIKAFSHNDPFSENVVLEARGDQFNAGLLQVVQDADRKRTHLTENFRQPITLTAIKHEESKAFLLRTIDELEISHIYVSSLRGHSLDVLEMPVPTTIAHHDIFLFCIARTAVFGSPCETCGVQELTQCWYGNLAVKNPVRIRYWLQLRDHFFGLLAKRNVAYIVNSDQIEERLLRLDVRFAQMEIHVVPRACQMAEVVEAIYAVRGDEVALATRWLGYLRQSTSETAGSSSEVV